MSADLIHRKRVLNNQDYILSMRAVFNVRALYSDTTSNYLNPEEPEPGEEITVRFRTAKNNVDVVLLVSGGKRLVMTKTETERHFDYYETRMEISDKKLAYHFEIISGALKVYFDSRGAVTDPNEYYDFVVFPGFSTPDWSKGAVMYQIYVDRFCNGDKTNDVLDNEYLYIGQPVHKVEDWYAPPSQMDVRNFYGGDLQGVLDKMDYLKSLGIEVIYFNPLFVSPSNHKYDIQDYDHIDPHFGKIVDDGGDVLPEGATENRLATRYTRRVAGMANLTASDELFIEVVKEAHKRGMKVILDGVFNHCGSFNKWMDRERIYENEYGYDKGAYVSSSSPYHSYFSFNNENGWPYNGSYDGWWGYDTLPKLNYEGSEELVEYVLKIAAKWVSEPFCADGWRLDVAADLGHSQEYNHKFWKRFRKAVKEANPNALILAEHYGDKKAWLQGDEWDSVMNYDAFMEPVTWFLTGMEKHSDDFREDLLGNADGFWGAMTHHGATFSTPSMQSAMNELSNHDHSRFLTRTNHMVGRTGTLGPEAAEKNIDKAVFREAVVIQMTWMGAPTIYYGDEAGVCGFTDPDNRRTYPWGREDKEMISFHRDLISLRHRHPVFRTGSIKMVDSDYNFIAYGRFDRNEQILVIINNNDTPVHKDLTVWEIGTTRSGIMKTVFSTDKNGYNMGGEQYSLKCGILDITVPAESATILAFYKSV
ncbi:MAG: alpha-glycosidase [Lachnospiraceae bacterium]|nr:alpha-glycosidase [Lachnospiraceae bacterium]